MIGTSETAINMAARRLPTPRIHAIPAPKSSMSRFIEAMRTPVVLMTRDGRVASANASAGEFFAGRAGTQLREMLETSARVVMGDRRMPLDAPSRTHAFETAQARFIATFVVAGTDLASQDIGAMVLLRCDVTAAHGDQCEATLAKRFGLTAQESRVAVMLAEHRSNREIADLLGVSVHTARHHTERVLAKLHIHSRYDVKRVIA
jgi:DNA-binding CsgD family transcriptional regulator